MALGAEPVDLSEIVRTTVESFTPAVLAKQQQVRLDLAPQAWVTGDAHRLRQVDLESAVERHEVHAGRRHDYRERRRRGFPGEGGSPRYR